MLRPCKDFFSLHLTDLGRLRHWAELPDTNLTPSSSPSRPLLDSLPRGNRLLILVCSRAYLRILDHISQKDPEQNWLRESQTFVHSRIFVHIVTPRSWQKPPNWKRMEVTTKKNSTHKYGVLIINIFIYSGTKLFDKYLLSPSLYSRYLAGNWGYSDELFFKVKYIQYKWYNLNITQIFLLC